MLIDVVEKYLTGTKWIYNINEGRDVIDCSVQGNNSVFKIYFVLEQERDFISINIHIENIIPENKRLHVSEYITRINYNLSLGNFRLNMENGDIRFQLSTDFEDSSLSIKMLENMLWAGINTFDKYQPGLMQVIYANISPKDAILSIDKPTAPSSNLEH